MKLVNVHTLFWGVIMAGLPGYLTAQALTLEQCLDTALVFNRTLESNRTEQAIAQLRQEEARAILLPKVTADADYKYFTNLPTQLLPLEVFNGPEGMFRDAQFGVPHNIGLNIQATLPVYQPRFKGGIQATAIASEISDLRYRQSEEQVIFEVTRLYYNGQILHHQLDFIGVNVANIDKLLANISLLREQGMAMGTDVDKLKLQSEQLVDQRAQAESKLEQVLNSLKFWMGIPLSRNVQIEADIRPGQTTTYPILPSIEVRIAQASGRLLATELHTLQQSKLPSVSLFANYGLAGFGYGQQPEPFFRFFPIGFVGVQATYTIWDETTRLQIEQKKVEQHKNHLQTEQISAKNELLIANAFLNRSTAEGRMTTSSKHIELAEKIYQQTVLQQKQGTANLTDVLLADNTLREAQQDYLNTIIEYLKADLELKKVSGAINP